MSNIKVTFYQSTAPPNTINKQKSLAPYPLEYENLTFNTDYDYMNCTIKFNVINSSNSIVTGFQDKTYNYFIVGHQDANKETTSNYYYFISGVNRTANGLVVITGRLDVLTTYRKSILNSAVMLERSDTPSNSNIYDAMYPTSMVKSYNVLEFEKGFSTSESDGVYLLITNQKGYTTGSGGGSGGSGGGSGGSGSSTSGTYSLPIEPPNITSRFGNRTNPITNQQELHRGTDFGHPAGTPIKTIADGTVIRAEMHSSWGNHVVIQHKDGKCSLYAHQSEMLVSKGASVKKGDVIGKVGSTGDSTGPHLHLEISRSSDLSESNLLNPEDVLGIQG